MTTICYNDAKALCSKKGAGWHLMSNLEWAAIALMSYATGNSKPGAGRNNRNILSCVHVDGEQIMNEIGDPSQSHDGTIHGIIGMNGYLYELVDGIYVKNTHGIVRNIFWNGRAEDGAPINAFDNPNYVCVDNVNVDRYNSGETGAEDMVSIDFDDAMSYTQTSPAIRNKFVKTEICGNIDLYPQTKNRDINYLQEQALAPISGMTEELGAYGTDGIRPGLETRALSRGTDIWNGETGGLFGWCFDHQFTDGHKNTSFRSVYISK